MSRHASDSRALRSTVPETRDKVCAMSVTKLRPVLSLPYRSGRIVAISQSSSALTQKGGTRVALVRMATTALATRNLHATPIAIARVIIARAKILRTSTTRLTGSATNRGSLRNTSPRRMTISPVGDCLRPFCLSFRQLPCLRRRPSPTFHILA